MNKVLADVIKSKKQQGYTLVEILIAITTLACGLMALASMQVAAIRTNNIASGISRAVTLAQAKVEELMNLPYSHTDLRDADRDGTDQDTDDDGADDDGGRFGLNDTVDAGGAVVSDNHSADSDGGYAVHWNVAVDVPLPGSKTIRVIVTWSERGRNKCIALDFVRTDLG